MSYSKESKGFSALVTWAKATTSGLEGPAQLLKHLQDGMHYHHFHIIQTAPGRTAEQLRRDDHYFTGHLLIEQLVPAWYAAGPDMHEKMAEGLLEVLSFCGYEGLLNFLNAVLVGFGSYSEGCQWNLKGLDEFTEMVELFKSMVAAAEAYEVVDEQKPALAAA